MGGAADVRAVEARTQGRTARDLEAALARARDDGEALLARLCDRSLRREAARPEADRQDVRLEDLALSAEDLAPRDEGFAFLDEIRGRVSVALLRLAEPWLVPCYLGTGGVEPPPLAALGTRDAVPERLAASHIASVLGVWDRRHGPLAVAYASADTLEVTVARPARTPDEVRLLVLEQYAVCQNLVLSAAGSTEVLARELAGSHHWLFWWES